MSLLKFLTAGPSFDGRREITNRYRMRPENLLPKFISPKNPFAQPPKPEAVRPAPAAAKLETGSLFGAEPCQPPAAQVAAPTVTPVAVPVATPPAVPPCENKASLPRASRAVKVEMKQPEPKPAARPVAIEPTAAPVPAPVTAPAKLQKTVREPRRWFGWIGWLNPLRLLRRKPSSTQSRSRGVAGRPVQAELTLDRVQPVRNDLKDADLEIVPGRLMGLPSGASPVLGNPARPDHSGFSRMTNRIFGLEHTHI